MTTRIDKQRAQEIIEFIQSGNYDLSTLNKEDFIQAVCSDFGCNRATARYAAKLTGNY